MKKQIILFIALFMGQFAFSQEYTSTSKEEFISYVQQQDAYYQYLIDQNNGSTEGIQGYKSYMRWKARYADAAYNSNGMYNVLTGEHNFNINYITYRRFINSTETDWEEIGPIYKPDNYLSEGILEPNRGIGIGRIFSIEFDPTNSNRVFAGSPTGGLYYSEDHGSTWNNARTDQLPNPGISHMQIVPANGNNPETWFILTGDGDNAWSYFYGVFRSQNQGQSWESISSGLNMGIGIYGRKLLLNPSNPNELFVILKNGLYKTDSAMYTDVNWQKIEDPSFSDMHFTDICYKPNSNYQTLYVAARDSIFVSTNAGLSFSAMPNLNASMFMPDSLKHTVRITLGATPANNQILYAAITNNDNGSSTTLYKFNDNGNNQWIQKGQIMPFDTILNNDTTEIEPIGYGRYQGFAVSPTNENVIYKSRVEYIDKSIDGGDTWQHLSNEKHDDTHWICFENNDPDKIWIGTDGGIHYTNNDFNTIEDKTYNMGIANVYNVSPSQKDHDMFIIGTWDCGSIFLHPDSLNWGSVTGGDAFKGLINDNYTDSVSIHVSIGSTPPKYTYENTPGYKFRNWWHPSDTTIGANGWPNRMESDYKNNDIIYYPGKYRVGRSTDNGVNWEPISPIAGSGNEVPYVIYRLIENCPINRDVLYVSKIKVNNAASSNNFKILRSFNCRDNAANVIWQDVTPILNGDTLRRWWTNIAINGNNPNQYWVIKQGYGETNKVIFYDGTTWHNITSDNNGTLDGLTIFQIEWINRPDNLLMLGTNCGIYYKTDNMTNWTKLDGMPNVFVREIVQQPEINKFLVATYGRGLWRGSIPCDIAGGDIVINSNTTWNSDQMIPNELIIEPGATLTINNSDITFATQKRLIVKNGAKLVLHNSKLDSRCSEKWAGVEVWGDTSHTQTETYQGKIEMYNSTIANAHEAVQLWKPNDYGKTGGMIYAENSTFLNNRRAVAVLSYKNLHPVFGIESDYAANFKRCTFKNNGNYFPDNPFYAFVSMWDVRGVKFKACMFDAGDFSQSAIYAIDAGFKAESICNGAIGPDGCLPQDLERCEFYGFDKAISTQNSVAACLYPVNIQHAYFYNNNYGVWANNLINVLTVKTSEFLIGKHGENKEKQICGSFYGRGIHIQAGTGFFIENNSFAPVPDANLGDDVIGIVAMDNPSYHDIIKNNSFSGLFVGNHAFGDNREDQNSEVGIEYQCNQNTENVVDFEVVGDPETPLLTRINPDLGAVNFSARNSFSGVRNQWHWRNMGQADQNYYIHSTENQSIYEPDSLKIETLEEDAFIKEVANTLNECADDGGIHEERLVLTPEEQQELEIEYAAAANEYTAVETIYNNLKDGGSTEGTSLTIESALPGDTWELRDNLLGMSPYLSREVLELAANRTDVLPNSVLLDILAANPDELKKNDFIRFLENKEEPLPAYMIEILKDLSSGVTYKTALLRQMVLQKRTQVVAAKKILNSYINKDEQDLEAIKGWLGNIKNYRADMQLAAVLIQEENYTNADALLALIPDLYYIEGEALELYNDEVFLLNLKATLQQQNRNMMQLNNTEIQELETIANNERGMARAYARIILEAFYNYDEFCDCIDRNENKKAFTEFGETINEKDSPLYIYANPNPAKHYLEFYYELSEIDTKGIIIITDINGKQIQVFNVNQTKGVQAWDIRKVPAGSYIYTLKTKYFEESGKLIIQ